ncbi:MAG: glycosyltransferase family 4 protein [Thermomicrobiales bacterium]
MDTSNLHVGVNTLFLALGRYGGIETYVRELLRELPALDAAVAYTLFTSPQAAGTFGERAPTVEEVICPLPQIANRKIVWSSRLAYEYGILPQQAVRRKVDVLFSPCFTAPAHPRYISVVTIPDMQYIDMPENFASVDHAIFTRLLSHAVRSTAHILTLSEHAKRRIVAHYQIPPERVTVTYLAAASAYFMPVSPETIARVRERYGLKAPYILSVATLHPHKNLDALIDAFVALRQTHAWKGQLALIGLRGTAANALHTRIRALGLAREIVLPGYVPDADLPALYRGAEMYVLPSRYEGFGIPVLEAMASGIPVITTRLTSLPEVAGDAALFFDPDDRAALVAALCRLRDDDALRRTLIARGHERARLFTWQQTAERTLAVFEHVASE